MIGKEGNDEDSRKLPLTYTVSDFSRMISVLIVLAKYALPKFVILKALIGLGAAVSLPKTQMWRRSMTNIRALRLVIVCSTGADYGSLVAPLCACVCVWVEGWTTRRVRQRALICDTMLSVEVPSEAIYAR